VTAAPEPAAKVSRTRIILARVLVVIGVILVVVSLLSNWVKREALDKETFASTSQELIAHPAIQNQLAQTMVEQLYANVDVSAQLEQKLPPNLQALSGPIAGLSRELIDRAAVELLQRPRVQSLFVNAASLAQSQTVRVLEGDTTRLQTTGGNVVLDLHPLVQRLGDRFGFLANASGQLPPDAGRIVLLQSDQLNTAQNLTQALKSVADWIWVPALLAWALALWLVPGRRRKEVRAIAIGWIVAGVALLVIRRVAGSYLVDNLTDSDSVRPALSAFWNILSDGLKEAAWAVVVIGIIGTLGAWVTGEGTRAAGTRRWLGPWLARPGLAWGVFAAVLLLVIWALPLQRFLIAAILAVLACAGFEVARRQAVAEYEAEGGEAARPQLSMPFRRPATTEQTTQVEELERLARLRSDQLLTEEEYAAAKGRLLGAGTSG
jgi:hypothetical protein